jgi:hypothetical protein
VSNPVTDLWWERLPRAVGRRSSVGHLVLTDGSYLRALPNGAWAPVAAFAIGLLLGFRPWEDGYATFSQSLTFTMILVGIGVLGAGLGVAAWVGWCLGDFVASTPAFVQYSTNGRLVCDLVLGVGMILVPVIAVGARTRTERLVAAVNGDLARWAGWAAFAVTAAVAVYVWELSVPQLVRPLWVFNRVSPDLPAIEPLQRDVGLTTSFNGLKFTDGLFASSLALAALVLGIVRAVLSEVATGRDPVAAQPVSLPAGTGIHHAAAPVRQAIDSAAAGGSAPQLATLTAVLPDGAAAEAVPSPTTGLGPAVIASLVGALLTAVVLAGLTTTTEPRFNSSQWTGMLAAFAIAALVRNVGLGFVPVYVRLVNRVPVVIRIAVAAVVSRSIASGMIKDALEANDTDFSSLLVPMLVAVGVAAVLIPGRLPTERAEWDDR